jgi:hypothetical protein
MEQVLKNQLGGKKPHQIELEKLGQKLNMENKKSTAFQSARNELNFVPRIARMMKSRIICREIKSCSID